MTQFSANAQRASGKDSPAFETKFGSPIQMHGRFGLQPMIPTTQVYGSVEISDPIVILLKDQRLGRISDVTGEFRINDVLLEHRFKIPETSEGKQQRILLIARARLERCMRDIAGALTSAQFSDPTLVSDIQTRFSICQKPELSWVSIDFKGAILALNLSGG